MLLRSMTEFQALYYRHNAPMGHGISRNFLSIVDISKCYSAFCHHMFSVIPRRGNMSVEYSFINAVCPIGAIDNIRYFSVHLILLPWRMVKWYRFWSVPVPQRQVSNTCGLPACARVRPMFILSIKQTMLTRRVQVSPNSINFCFGIGSLHSAIRIQFIYYSPRRKCQLFAYATKFL